MNVRCNTCKQDKKTEHFTTLALASEVHVCNSCDLMMLQKRIAGIEKQVLSLRKKQEAVKEVTKHVEEVLAPPIFKMPKAKRYLQEMLSA